MHIIVIMYFATLPHSPRASESRRSCEFVVVVVVPPPARCDADFGVGNIGRRKGNLIRRISGWRGGYDVVYLVFYGFFIFMGNSELNHDGWTTDRRALRERKFSIGAHR